MLTIPEISISIQEILLPFETNVRLFMKREDCIHPEISGNKYWKLFFNVNRYLELNQKKPLLITFGGAYSNHIAAVSAFASLQGMPSIGVIRGEELIGKWQTNPTLQKANANGMKFDFVTRESYQNKEELTEYLIIKYPQSLIIPEGGTNENAVEGIQFMLSEKTQEFDYLCTAVGTGGTLAGLSKFCSDKQQVIGFKAVNDDSLKEVVASLSGKNNFELIDAHDGGYGRINEENIRFINAFYQENKIPLDPIYTGKMMRKLLELIDNGFFPKNSKILAFHTGGLQGIEGANQMLAKQNKQPINFNL